MLDYTPEEYLGKPDPRIEILHPEDRERVLGENRCIGEGHEFLKMEYRLIHLDGSVEWVHDEAVLIEGPDHSRFWRGVITDVTERNTLKVRLEHRALHDLSTGLPNHRLFVDRLAQALNRTRRRKDLSTAVLFVDLDDFKVINES